MKVEISENVSGQYFDFFPENEYDIFLLGKISSKIKSYNFSTTRDDNGMKMTRVGFQVGDFLKLVEDGLNI